MIKDFNEQLLKVLRNFSIMRLEFQQFEGLRRQIAGIFAMLDDKIQEFKASISQSRARIDARYQQVMKEIVKNALQDRLNRIMVFRGHHHRLTKIIRKKLSKEKSDDR